MSGYEEGSWTGSWSRLQDGTGRGKWSASGPSVRRTNEKGGRRGRYTKISGIQLPSCEISYARIPAPMLVFGQGINARQGPAFRRIHSSDVGPDDMGPDKGKGGRVADTLVYDSGLI